MNSLDDLTPIQQRYLLTKQLIERKNQRRLFSYYPDDGPLRRELYPKSLAFFEAGARHRERLMLAANRVGKTEGVGGYELALHLTGLYPDWWRGHRFDKPIRAWVAGDTAKTVRDIIQTKLLGPHSEHGTGLIPGETIKRMTAKAGVADAVDEAQIKHESGGISLLSFKSYDQGRKAFQGTEQDIIWLDEECPMDIYSECLVRTMTTSGLMLLTFTPLSGLTELVLSFLPSGKIPEVGEVGEGSKCVIMATWDDVPHLSDDDKRDLWESIPPYQRDARSKGIPQLGSGAIYPVAESEIVVAPFQIPDWWPRAYALDVGWNRTAAVWGATDPQTGVSYLYSEYYKGQAEPSIHAEGIRSRGNWVPGAIDPAARGRGQNDGNQLLQNYLDLGLDLTKANNAVESGLYEVWQALSSGRLKVFESLGNLLSEYRIYRRDNKGCVVKANDHLMDAMRYYWMTGRHIATVEPFDLGEDDDFYHEEGRSSVTGY